jgi:acetyl-CoA C-acetyltransferase
MTSSASTTKRPREAVICCPLRTPVGRYGGVLREVSPQELAATVIRAIMARASLDPAVVDDVVLGNANPSGEFPALGRVAALDAGLPITTTGAQVDRRCGSGLYAVLVAAMQVEAGVTDLAIAGGAESMSQSEFYSSRLRFDLPRGDISLHDRLARARITVQGRNYHVDGGMLETAENLRREFSIPRSEQDELALESHRRAVAAQRSGAFDQEIAPVTIRGSSGEATVVVDEHPRADTSLERLAALKPARVDADAEATVTAGNASGQNDGAAACVVTTRERADALGLRPLARILGWAVSGVEPHRMGIGPVPSSALALSRAGLALKDIDLIELNEAFAAQVLAVTRMWEFGPSDFERLNVNGSGISLGHPVGATGARMLTTLLYEMDRREVPYGLATMCIGGGQGLAAVFERLT